MQYAVDQQAHRRRYMVWALGGAHLLLLGTAADAAEVDEIVRDDVRTQRSTTALAADTPLSVPA